MIVCSDFYPAVGVECSGLCGRIGFWDCLSDLSVYRGVQTRPEGVSPISFPSLVYGEMADSVVDGGTLGVAADSHVSGVLRLCGTMVFV